MAKRTRNGGPNRQSVRLDGRDCFVEVATDAFEIGKIVVKALSYDKTKATGSRVTDVVDVYLEPSEAYALAKMICDPGNNGIVRLCEKAVKDAQDQGKKYPAAVYESAIGGRTDKDGNSICRQLTIQPGSKMPYIITAIQGKGKTTQTGGIVFDGAPSTRIMIPMDHFSLLKFAGGLEGAFIGYSAKYFTGEHAGSNNSQKPTFEAEPEELPY